MAKSASFKWCALLVGCAVLYVYHTNNKSHQNTSPFGAATKIQSGQMQQPASADETSESLVYTGVPARDNNMGNMMRGTDMPVASESNDVFLDSALDPPEDIELDVPFMESTPEENQVPPEMDGELFEFGSEQPAAPANLPRPDRKTNNELISTQPGVTLPQGVQIKVVQHIEYGKSLARRGAVFGAKNEFHGALRLVAQAVDYQMNSSVYSDSLFKAMLALKEADDFYFAQAENGGRVDIASLAKHHESKILSPAQMRNMAPVEAMQTYYDFVQKNFAMASGRTIVASEAMFCLGKLYLMKGKDIVDGSPLDNAKAIVHHRAALDCNAKNYKSANELAVLLAKTGRLEQAKNLLIHSLKIQQVPQAWENLSFIHQQLGEPKMAELAFSEYQRMLNAPPTTQQINWVSPEQFASQSAEPPALRTAMNPNNTKQVQQQPQPPKESSFRRILKKVF